MNIKNIRCWFLGCPVIENVMCEEDEQCKHCGRFRVDYYGQSTEFEFYALDPIHKRIYERISDLLFKIKSIVFPDKCWQCGHRYKHDESVDHLPF